MKARGYILASALLPALCGCAGLRARREAAEASKAIASAESAFRGAKDGGYQACAPAEMKQSDSDLKSAKANQEKQNYALASTLARSSEAKAALAAKKCGEVRRREAEQRTRQKKK